MRITIESDSGSGSATPAVSTSDQTPGSLAAPVTVNAGSATGVPGGGLESNATAVTAVNAGSAAGAAAGGAQGNAAPGATVDAGAAPSSLQKRG